MDCERRLQSLSGGCCHRSTEAVPVIWRSGLPVRFNSFATRGGCTKQDPAPVEQEQTGTHRLTSWIDAGGPHLPTRSMSRTDSAADFLSAAIEILCGLVSHDSRIFGVPLRRWRVNTACIATRHPIGCVGSLPRFQVKASPHLEQLSDSLNLRLTHEQKAGLMAAVRHTPGAASPSGVARYAIDDYLERVLRRPSPA